MSDSFYFKDREALLARIQLLESKIANTQKAQNLSQDDLSDKSLDLQSKNRRLEKANTLLLQKLDSSENKLGIIVKNIRDVIYEVNSQGFVVVRNDMFTGLLGYAPEEIEKKPFWEFIDEPARDRVQNFYSNCIDNKIVDSYYEVPIRSKGGDLMWFGQNVHLEFSQNQRDFKAFVIARDITENRQIRAEQELENNRLKHLINSMRSGILIENADRRIEMINREFCDLFEIKAPPELLIGSDCSDSAEQSKTLFKHPESFVRGIEKLLTEQKSRVKERIEMSNGKILLRDYIPIWLNRENRGHMWIYKDVTELELKNREIMENQRKYTSVIESLNLGVIEVDREERITRVFPKFEELTGYKTDELIGKNPQEVFVQDERAKQIHNEVQKLRLKGQGGDAYESILQRKDGSLINVMIAGAPIKNVFGESIGSIGVHFDITEQKQRQRELEQAKKNQERITARLSHELRNPITAIDGKLELLVQMDDLEQVKQEIKQVSESVALLKLITDDALVYSTLTAGNSKLNLVNTAFKDYVTGIAAGVRSMAINKGLDFHISIDPAIPEYLVIDKKMMGQVLINLLSNAVKFTNEGFTGIEIKGLELSKEHTVLQIDVFDSGIGIEDEQIEKVTQEYFRGSNVSEEQTGTGLGLSIVQETLHHMGSELKVSSKSQEGSCFSFVIQLKNGKILQNVSPTLSEKRFLKKVLVVEDDQQVRSFICMVLKKVVNQIIEAKDASEGLDQFENHDDIDLVIVDYQMPGLDGLSMLKELRKTSYDSLIFFMSANMNSQLRQNAEAIQIDECISKPFSPKELTQLLKKHFNVMDAKPSQKKPILINELDTEHLRCLYGGNKEYLENAFRMFLKKLASSMALITNSLRMKDYKLLRFYMHKLKPSISMVGLEAEAEMTREIEKLCDDEADFTRIEKDVNYILKSLQKHKSVVEKQLKYLQNV